MIFRRLILGGAVAAVLGGCGARGPTVYQLEADALYERGKQELDARDWQGAIRAFEHFVAQYPTHARVEEVRLHIGEAYFGKKEYVTAASEFTRLVTDYPTSVWADDARYKTCESYYRLSPKPQLDQEYTRAAIEHCQALISYYPSSKFAPQAQGLIDDLREKLAAKAYLNGDYYFKRKALDSSIIYFEDVVGQYPKTSQAPRALLRLVQVYQQLGYREEMEAAKERMQREYPGTAEAKLAQEITLADSR